MARRMKIVFEEDNLRGYDEIGGKGITEIKAGNRILNYVCPAEGPAVYRNVGRKILENGLRVPTGDDFAPLIYSAYFNKKDKDNLLFVDIKEILNGGDNNSHLIGLSFYVFNRYVWTPQGVYVKQDLRAEGTREDGYNRAGLFNSAGLLRVSRLERTIKNGKEIDGVRFSEDGRVRFAPKDTYKLGKNTPRELAKNGFIIAGYGVRGAEQLAEVSATFEEDPYVSGVDVSEEYYKSTCRNFGIQGFGALGGYFSLAIGTDDEHISSCESGGVAFGIMKIKP